MSNQAKLLSGTLIALAALALCSAEASAQSWRAVQSADGITWARVKFVNESAEPSNWTVWNGRAAVSSTADTALTDQQYNWDGVVNAGETRYVWIYGLLAGSVNIANCDGEASTHYPGNESYAVGGDGELVITIAADGTVSVSTEAASYGVPAYAGDFDPYS